jgi:hypothetical protein
MGLCSFFFLPFPLLEAEEERHIAHFDSLQN